MIALQKESEHEGNERTVLRPDDLRSPGRLTSDPCVACGTAHGRTSF